MPFSRDATRYLVSRPGTPFDRLEVLQEALTGLAGASHLAPVTEPARILDVGAGLDRWLREVNVEFPSAFAVGAAIDARRHGPPPSAAVAVRADLDQDPLPFADGAFDYVHHRAVPLPGREVDGPRRLARLVRVLAPGGWLEIVTTEPAVVPLSPTTELLLRQVLRLLDIGSDPQPPSRPLPALLRAEGLVDVEERRFELPVGAWGGQVGEAMLSNFRAVMGAVASALDLRFRIPALDTLGMVARASEEIEQRETVAPVWFVWGRRPG